MEFAGLVDNYHVELYRFALSLTGNEIDAQDLTQQTFWICAKGAYQFCEPARVRRWLHMILLSEHLRRRRHRTRDRREEPEPTIEELPPVPANVVNHLEAPQLLKCLAQLEPAFQGPVALFYLKDYSYHDIAEISQIPLGTVKSRIAHGIARLQALAAGGNRLIRQTPRLS